MTNLDMKTLNEQFAIPGHLSFTTGCGRVPQVEINNSSALATIALLGAHVMLFQPHGHKPVLWMSENSWFEEGKAIRGGIPICWPWFATHPTDPNTPNHGIVRTELWDVKETTVVDEGTTRICLGISDSERTRVFWPYPFELEMIVTVGTELQVELITRNSGQTEFTFGEAFHTYYAVSDVTGISIDGLDGFTYLDKVEAFEPNIQQGAITINAETDRIYLDTMMECIINDPGFQRRIHIAKAGSQTTVVWNPWIKKSQRMTDFGDREYPGMVCVETANADKNVLTLRPGSTHCLRAVISVESVGIS